MSAEPPAFPKALDDDDDDVAWALQTAAVQWERGGHADAVVWLRRAAESAIEAGKYGRGADLQRGANLVETWVERGVVGPAPDEDDGIDDLLATEAPDIETSEMRGLSQSLVDVLEAEERGELGTGRPPQFSDVTDVGDLGDLEDVEDIEADDVVDLSEDIPFVVEEPPTQAIPSSRRSRLVAVDAGEQRTTRPPASGGTGVLPPLPIPRISTRPPKPTRSVPAPVPVAEPAPPPNPPSARPPMPSETVAVVSSDDLESEPPPPSVTAEELAPPSVRLRSEPPFEATLVDVSPAMNSPSSLPAVDESPTDEPPPAEPSTDEPPLNQTATDEPVVEAALMDPPFVEPTLVEAQRPPSDAPPPDTSPSGPRGTTDAPSQGVDVALLESCRGLEDLPPETQVELAARATLEKLAPEQEVSGFGLAIVAAGDVAVMPTIAEGACGHARRGEPVFSRGNLAEGVSLRVVALADGAEVAVFRAQDFEHVLETCPWVADELRTVADRFQALAGVAMGPLGERLDDMMRAMVTDRCEVRLLQAGDVLIEQSKPVPGLQVVGGGRLEAVRDGVVTGELMPGDLVFGSSVLSHEPAPATLRAAEGGALVVIVDRMTTHELLVSVPPLLELLATS